jgi:hypothetical protein
MVPKRFWYYSSPPPEREGSYPTRALGSIPESADLSISAEV